MINLKRIYAPISPQDGKRFLVDRLWPRGMKKETAHLDAWLKDVAPSQDLRTWFAHDSSRWEEFQRRYALELNRKPEIWQPILAAASAGRVTLLCAARDLEHSNAAALKSYLEQHQARANGA
jgi:uncharacterized protein YeaO (DUF488 family)